MRHTRLLLFVAPLALLMTLSASLHAQKPHQDSTRAGGQVLSLDFSNNGQRVSAWVGQQIEISLGTVGPRQYGDPEISSPAVQLVSTALEYPQNPGGPRFIYIFEAVAAGETRVRVPVVNRGDVPYTNDITFSVTIRVGPAHDTPPALRLLLKPDQSNPAPWNGAWTNLYNFVQQTFTPSLPRLTGVEVELVVANPGPESAEITMMVLNSEGVGLALVSKRVSVGDRAHVLFILPRGGLAVSPGKTYSIKLSGGDGLFGWKYVVGGYAKGDAWFNSKPLLKDARSTFLFRTFGTSWE